MYLQHPGHTGLLTGPLARRAQAAARGRVPWRTLEALATPHGLDRYLELLDPMLTVRELRAQVVGVARPTVDSVRLTLRPTRQWQGFAAGQFVAVSLDIDGVRRTRCYSPANSQHRADGHLELTVRAHDKGLVSQHLYRHARPGLVVGLDQAAGTFRLPERRPDRLLLISAGSGITPVLAMLRTLLDEGHDGQIAFVHYARRGDRVPYLQELRDLAAASPNVRLALGYPSAGGGELAGRFTPDHLEGVAPWYRDAAVFLCGPATLTDAVRAHLDDLGLADRLHTEDFAPPARTTPGVDDPSVPSGTTTFARSVTTSDNTGDTLLEQAEAAGLRPDFGCRMGICFTCTRTKTAGAVRNIRTGELSDDPDVEIQLCITRPVGDVTVDL